MSQIPMGSPSRPAHIRITSHGPYLLSGTIALGTRTPVRNEAGEAVAWTAGESRGAEASTALCRCGHSGNKPFCDGTHGKIGFDGTCTADRSPANARRKRYEGGGITMTDDDSLCAGYEYCDRFGGVWRTIARAAEPEVRSALIEQISLCPSGRLQYMLEGDGEPREVTYSATIATIPDGPLWVLGNIPVTHADGFTYEVRNRQLLCRCGASHNKPFCDGSHARVGFRAP